MQPGSRLHRERTSKKTRFRCQSFTIQNYIKLHKIYNTMIISPRFFKILYPFNFNSSWTTRGNKADPRQFNTITKTQFIIHPSRFITIDPSIGSCLGGRWIFPMRDVNTIPFITLSGLNHKNFHSFQSPFEAIFTRMFIPFPYSNLSQ